MREGIDNGVYKSSRRSDVWRFSNSFRTKGMVRRWRASAARFPVRCFHRRRNQVVHETTTLDIAVFVVVDQLHEGDGQAFGQAAVDLTFHNHRVDDVTAIVHCHEAPNLYLSGTFVDVHHANVSPEREREVRWIVIIDGFEPSFETSRNIRVSSESDFLDALGFARCTLHKELAGFPLQIFLAALQ